MVQEPTGRQGEGGYAMVFTVVFSPCTWRHKGRNQFEMNTAILLLMVHTLSLATAIVVKDYIIQVKPPSIPPATLPQIQRESSHHEGGNHIMHKDSGHGSGDHSHSNGGSSVGHHETGNSGHELKETSKKEHGSHEGDKAAHIESANGEEGGEHKLGHKHHAHHKAGANKKSKKMSKGYNEEYHKDEKKSTGGHWAHEHTEGKYIQFGKKRGKGGGNKAKKSDKVEKRSDDTNAAGNTGFENMDQLMTVMWSTNKKPVYEMINQSLFKRQQLGI